MLIRLVAFPTFFVELLLTLSLRACRTYEPSNERTVVDEIGEATRPGRTELEVASWHRPAEDFSPLTHRATNTPDRKRVEHRRKSGKSGAQRETTRLTVERFISVLPNSFDFSGDKI